MGSSNLTWIQTRDGSPTLWSNELAESYRSVKGAFTESWAAFVGPALRYALTQNEPQKNQAVKVLGEFGLGLGTNWALWTLGTHIFKIPSPHYVAIEKDLEAFKLGLQKFINSPEIIEAFFQKQLPSQEWSRNAPIPSREEISSLLLNAPRPQVFPALEDAVKIFSEPHQQKIQIWFHDPFGYDVNPEGYSTETLQKISLILDPQFWGASYACNRHFKEALQVIPNVRLQKEETGDIGLKRERLEFFRD